MLGSFSLVEKLANGACVFGIQWLAHDRSSAQLGNFFRDVVAFVPAACVVLGFLVVLLCRLPARQHPVGTTDDDGIPAPVGVPLPRRQGNGMEDCSRNDDPELGVRRKRGSSGASGVGWQPQHAWDSLQADQRANTTSHPQPGRACTSPTADMLRQQVLQRAEGSPRGRSRRLR